MKKAARIKDDFTNEERADIESQLDSQEVEMEFVDGLHAMLASIFSQYGDSVEYNPQSDEFLYCNI